MWLWIVSAIAFNEPSHVDHITLSFFPNHASSRGFEPWKLHIDDQGRCFFEERYRCSENRVGSIHTSLGRLSPAEWDRLNQLLCQVDLEGDTHHDLTLRNTSSWDLEITQNGVIRSLSGQTNRFVLDQTGVVPLSESFLAFADLVQWLNDRAGNPSGSTWPLVFHEWQTARSRLVAWCVWCGLLLVYTSLIFCGMRRWVNQVVRPRSRRASVFLTRTRAMAGRES